MNRTKRWSRRCARSCCKRADPAPRRSLLVLLLFLGACSDFRYEGFLSQPIPILVTQETPVIPVLFGGRRFDAVIDTASPLTALTLGTSDTFVDGELRLQHGTQPTISRFVFHDVQVLDLSAESLDLGLDTPFTATGLLGASILRHFAVALDYGVSPQLTFSDEIPDTKAELASECDPSRLVDPLTAGGERCQGTFYAPVVGGGMASIGGGDLTEIPATRLALPLCLQPKAFDPTVLRGHGAEAQSGVPVIAVLATGIGTSIVTRTAYKRLLADDPSLSATPGSTLHLPYGKEAVSTLTLDRVAVVSDETNELNPCGELALRRRFLMVPRVPLTDADLRLVQDKSVDGASAAVIQGGISFVVMDDEAPLIQSLRRELEPQVANIDVVLGGSFLRSFHLLVDYPSSRVILRCQTADDVCRVLPWCAQNRSSTPRCPGLPD